jgi:DnaK suppressor protein
MTPDTVAGALSARQLQSLIAAIDAREKDLRARIAGERERASAEMASQFDGVIGDGADFAGARIRAGIESELMDRHLRDLAALDAARARVEAGTYGICVECAEPIGFERLRLNPSAPRCAACQSLREKSPGLAYS